MPGMIRPIQAAVVLGCALLLVPTSATGQESIRRSTDTPEELQAKEDRLKSFSRILWKQSRNLSAVEVGDAEILVHCGKVKSDSADYQSLEAMSDGDVLILTLAAGTKLRTEADLRFGETTIPTGNVAEGFAGTYSLWLRKVNDGWHLIFNNEADVWGTQRDPSRDFEEIQLVHESIEEPAEEMAVKITEVDGRGTLAILWGQHRWTTTFEVVEG